MANVAIARKPACPHGSLELAEGIHPVETRIKGVFEELTFSARCSGCEELLQRKSSKTCPYCFTSMETKQVDTEVRRFKKHPDLNLDPLHYARLHTCPTCTFCCVSFIYDR